MKISFSTKIPAATDALVVGAFEKRRLSPGAAEIDAKTKGALKQPPFFCCVSFFPKHE